MKSLPSLLCLIFLSTPAFAGGTTVGDFFGRWAGEGVAETETGEDTERQLRLLEVIVREHPAGIQLCWSTTRIETGKPGRQTFAMMILAPDRNPNHWTATFAADGSGTHASAEAELIDSTLRVTNRATNEAGETEVQVYERSLRQGGMDLYFTRYDDDRLARIVQGRLERASLSPGEPPPWC